MRRTQGYEFKGFTGVESKSEQFSIEMEANKKESWRKSRFDEIVTSGYIVQYQVIEPDGSEAEEWVSQQS